MLLFYIIPGRQPYVKQLPGTALPATGEINENQVL